jgi:hypothetical protein
MSEHNTDKIRCTLFDSGGAITSCTSSTISSTVTNWERASVPPSPFSDVVVRLGITPAEAIFIDDSQGNIERARSRGLHAIRHLDTATTMSALEQLPGIKLKQAERWAYTGIICDKTYKEKRQRCWSWNSGGPPVR